MTESSEHMNITDAVERLVAGEGVDPAGMDEESRRLLELAAELKDGASDPSAEFSERLGVRMEELTRECPAEAPAARFAQAGRAAGSASGWLPAWMTFPRMAGAVALLVVSLSIIGLTGAIIRGTGPAGAPDTGLVSKVDPADISGPAGGVQDSASSTNDIGTRGALEDQSLEQFAPETAVAGGTAAGSQSIPPLPSDQRVMETADYSIEVPGDEFQQRFNAVRALADKYGGYVVSATSSKTGEDEAARGSIIFRIANTGDNFARVQAELDEMGDVTSRNISGQDVTEEFVDLQSRLRNAEAHAAQLLTFMQQAQNVNETLMIQDRLTQVQAEIEQIKGRIQLIETRTDFATVTVNLREAGQEEETDDDGDTVWGFVDSLKYAGWLAVQTVNFVIISLGVIIPATLILALIGLLVYRLWRRRQS